MVAVVGALHPRFGSVVGAREAAPTAPLRPVPVAVVATAHRSAFGPVVTGPGLVAVVVAVVALPLALPVPVVALQRSG